MSRTGVFLLKDYLMAIENRISKHLEKVETDSLRIYHFELLKNLLSLISESYVNNRLYEIFDGIQLNALKTIEFDATLELLLSGLETERDKTRWTLCFLELNHYINPQFWKKEYNSVDIFAEKFAKATTLEQYNWVKIYVKSREIDVNTFDFATRPILLAVRGNENIKTRLLRELSLNNPRQLGFLLYAIPYDRRVKEIRYRHLTDRLLQRKIGKMQNCYRMNHRVPGISKTVAYQILRFMEDGQFYHDGEGSTLFRLNGELSLTFVTWILSLMTIYQFRWPLDFDINQIALLLSRKSSSPSEVFKLIKEMTLEEGTKVHERLEQAQSLALRMLPRLLSLEEILILLLPRQEFLSHKINKI